MLVTVSLSDATQPHDNSVATTLLHAPFEQHLNVFKPMKQLSSHNSDPAAWSCTLYTSTPDTHSHGPLINSFPALCGDAYVSVLEGHEWVKL